mgnify:CR=1 FL=1
MTIIFSSRVLLLSAGTGSLRLAAVALDPLTEAITVRIARPTTLSPLAWLESGQMTVDLIVHVDETEYRCSGTVSGGIRSTEESRGGASEISEYVLTYYLPSGYFGVPSEGQKRLGQTRRSVYTCTVDCVLVRGTIASVITVEAEERVAPTISFHSSVGFDTASGIIEISGDGVVSFSHTATGSNRAAFLSMGSEAASGAPGTHTFSYGGSAGTSIWTAIGPFTSQRYSATRVMDANLGSGAQTVTGTMVGATGITTQGMGCVTLTGVDQTTPVGTPAFHEAASGTTPSATVGTVGSDDLVVDMLFGFDSASVNPSPGANQTEVVGQQSGSAFFNNSYQAGVNGGVMSWTKSLNYEFMLGAVAFKPSAVTLPGDEGALWCMVKTE